jgi:uncharacterized protein (DUF2147 family)
MRTLDMIERCRGAGLCIEKRKIAGLSLVARNDKREIVTQSPKGEETWTSKVSDWHEFRTYRAQSKTQSERQ